MIWKIKAVTAGLNEKGKTTVLFACQELKKYFSMCTSDPVIVCESEETETDGIRVGVGLRRDLQAVEDSSLDDAILIDIKGREGVITGTNARSVLIAAYRYLKELGYSFIRPGKDGEKYPTRLTDRDISINEKASYRQRTVCIEGSVSYESVEDMIDWLPKVGMNGYQIQFFIPMIFFKRWYEHKGYEFSNPYLSTENLTLEDVAGMTRMLEREIEKRSLLYIKVGHGWTCDAFGMPGYGWEPVDLDEIPKGVEKYFAMRNGKREIFNSKQYHNVPMVTQLCYGNPEVRKIIIDYLVEYAKANPGIDYLDFGFADGANAYCECPLCRDTRPSDFLVMFLNEIDERLTAEGLSTKLIFGLYVDKLWPPVKHKIKNENRFSFTFAPISRSYTKPFPLESNCEIGEFVYNKLTFPTSVEGLLAYVREWRKVFPGEGFAFDYYYMWDCYKDLGCTETARVMHQDIRNYRDIGLNGLINCQGQRVFSPTSLGMNMIARTLWNRDCDFDEVRDEVLKAEFGKDYALVRDYLQDLSIYSLPEVTRMEKPLVDSQNTVMYEKGIDRARKFNLVIEDHLASAEGCEKVSWKYLKFHTALSVMLMSAFAEMSRGAEPESLWAPIEDFVNRNEWEMRQYFDVFEFKYTYGRLFPKIKNAQKELIIGT